MNYEKELQMLMQKIQDAEKELQRLRNDRRRIMRNWKGDGASYGEIASAIGTSRERVRQIIRN